jgi:hypothetical protein
VSLNRTQWSVLAGGAVAIVLSMSLKGSGLVVYSIIAVCSVGAGLLTFSFVALLRPRRKE